MRIENYEKYISLEQATPYEASLFEMVAHLLRLEPDQASHKFHILHEGGIYTGTVRGIETIDGVAQGFFYQQAEASRTVSPNAILVERKGEIGSAVDSAVHLLSRETGVKNFHVTFIAKWGLVYAGEKKTVKCDSQMAEYLLGKYGTFGVHATKVDLEEWVQSLPVLVSHVETQEPSSLEIPRSIELNHSEFFLSREMQMGLRGERDRDHCVSLDMLKTALRKKQKSLLKKAKDVQERFELDFLHGEDVLRIIVDYYPDRSKGDKTTFTVVTAFFLSHSYIKRGLGTDVAVEMWKSKLPILS